MAQIKLIKFKIFQQFPTLIHAFSTRRGGLSVGPFQSLNLGLNSGDDKQTVLKNRQLLFDLLNINPNRLVYPQQIHSSNVSIVDQPGVINNCDAVISKSPNLFLTIQTADCFPVFIFDPKTMAIGLVHSGWKGTSENIVGKTIKKMSIEFGSKGENILAGIGPGVQQRNYQVDLTVASKFEKKYLMPDGPGHCKLNIQKVIIDQLLEECLILDHIECNNNCSYEAGDLFYSYRRDGKFSGRMMGILGLTK